MTFPGEVFADIADFDSSIRQLLPRYDEMLAAIANCSPPQAERILELGCGTGELSLKILERCPASRLVAIDYSPRMLQCARTKLQAAGYGERINWIEADFGDWANGTTPLGTGNQLDACISSLAIHHLTDEMKLKLFQQIHRCLKPGGCFWNADPVLPEAPPLSESYQAIREDWARQQGTTLTEIRSKLGNSNSHGHSSHDRLATLSTHLQLLKTAGFDTIAVPWKYYGLAVFGGWS